MGIRIVDDASFAAAAQEVSGRQLVVAGPGTGKTHFLAHRAARLLEAGVDPDTILILTFNRRAAGELGARVRAHAGPAAPAASTFHGFAYGVLTRHGRRLVDAIPRVLTASEQRETVRRLLRDEEPEAWPPAQRPLLAGRGFVADIADFVLRAQENLLTPADVDRVASLHGIDDWAGVVAFFPRYRAHLAEEGAFDYGGLIAEVVHLLGADPALREHHATRYTHVLVDEYQDTNKGQAALLRMLTERSQNLTVVGDPLQSIYRFRGATLDNILSFPEEFPGAQVHTLEVSRRCPAPVLAAAESLTAGQRRALGARGISRDVAPAPHGGTVAVHVFPQQAAEAEWVARHLAEQHARAGVAWPRMAVLVRSLRTRFATSLRRALERAHVPAALARDPAGAEPPAVRAFLDLVEVSVRPESRDDLLLDVLCGPLVMLPVTAARALLRDAARAGRGIGAQLLDDPPPAAARVADLLAEPAWATQSVAAVGFAYAWDHLPIAARAARATLEVASGRDGAGANPVLAHVTALSAFAATLNRAYERRAPETLAEMWQAFREGDYEAEPGLGPPDRHDAVPVLTIHQAKGLEFDVVVLADCVDGALPDLRTRASLLRPEVLAGGDLRGAGAAEELVDEERRLAYVAITRARHRVVLTATQAVSGGRASVPSRFLTELGLGDELDDVVTPVAADHGAPLSVADAIGRWRRRFHDTTASPAARLAALRAVVALGSGPATWWGGAPALHVDAPAASRKASFSTLALYEDCPRRFLYDKVLGLGGESGEAASFGSFAHTLLEHLEDPTAGRTDLLQYGHELLDRFWDEAPFGYRFVARRRRRKAAEMLATYVRYRGLPEVLAREHWFDVELDGFRVRGKIDRVDRDGDGLRLVDYKTGNPDRYDVDADLQLRLYHLAASLDPALRELGEVRSLVYLFPEKTAGAGKAKTLKVLPLEADAELLTATEARVRDLLARLTMEAEYAPSATADCTHCDYRHLCPRWPEGQPPGVTGAARTADPSPDDARGVAADVASAHVQGTLW